MKKKKPKSPALEKLEKMCAKDQMCLAEQMGYKSGEPFNLMECFEMAYRLKKARQAVDETDQQSFAE